LNDVKSRHDAAHRLASQQMHMKDVAIQNLQHEVEIISASLEQVRLHNLSLQKENTQANLATDTDLVHQDQAMLKQELLEKEAAHKQTLKDMHSQISLLSEELERRKDYDEMQRKLMALCQKDHQLPDESCALESALVDKNRRLESELVKVRQELSDFVQAKASLTAELACKQIELDELGATVQQYEKKAQEPCQSFDKKLGDPSQVQNDAHLHSDDVIVVLTNQRERFKKRNQDLELVIYLLYDYRSHSCS
jgi:hypothetical protein